MRKIRARTKYGYLEAVEYVTGWCLLEVTVCHYVLQSVATHMTPHTVTNPPIVDSEDVVVVVAFDDILECKYTVTGRI